MSFRFHNYKADMLSDVFRHPVVTIPRTRDSTPVYTYTPQDLRAAYKSTPVAPSDRKKTVVIAIVMAYAFPATLLQSSLDAFCKLNDIPTTTLELIPINQVNQNEQNALIGIFADLIMSYVNSTNSNGNNFNPTTFESDYIIPCVEYLIENVNPAQQQAEGSFLVQSFLGMLDALEETLLDIQWSHAMNPNAHIRVVQSSGMNSTLFDAVKYASDPANFANNQWGPTDVISMSWGGPESAVSAVINELDTVFNNNKICYLAASGDVQTCQYPSTSANILSVGGTSLYYDQVQGTMSQTTWSNVQGGGGGCGPSAYIPKPDFQTGVSALSTYTNRCSPDIAGIADPSTGVNIIFGGGSTSGNAINSMYMTIGGTSLACPANAGMLSNIIQTSINRAGPTFTTVLNNGSSILLQKALYDLYKNVNQRSLRASPSPYAHGFYDVTQGTDNGFSAGPGFDVPTGLGSPYWDNISATWFYAMPSEICFPVNTPVLTDQGIIAIQNIEPGKHTLRNKRIVAVTQTVSHDDHLVHFSKHSLGHNYPTEDTRMSKHHKILYSGKMISARHFLTGFKNVTKVAYNNELLYNVLLDEHSNMQINNLTCETLHPRSAIAKLYTHNNNHNHAAPITLSRKFRNLFIKADARQYGCKTIRMQ
jgi:subtilase family serine protease